jgi:DNA-binding GntR family transcriptional regulator
MGFEDDLSPILDIDYHEEVVAAIEAQDAARARSAIVRDIEEGAAHILRQARFPGAGR